MARRYKAEAHKFLGRDQVIQLLSGPQQAGRARDYYLLSMMYYLALREAEAVYLRPEYLLLSANEALIPSVKRKPRKGMPTCPVTGRLLIRIPILFGQGVIRSAVNWAQSSNSPWLFPSRSDPTKPLSTRQVRRTFSLWSRAAGLPVEVSAHSLRHSAGTHVLGIASKSIKEADGDPLLLVRDFMRHKDLKTTSIYLHSTPAVIAAARAAMTRGT